jgi:membrane protein DedA with SNARE-associated domain
MDFSTHSYLWITIVLILTGSGLPIPEEVPIIAAGAFAANGSLDPLLAFACCVFGAIAGDCIMYTIGRYFGRGVLREHPWFARFVTPEREEQIEERFRQHGLKVFFVARFLVALRSPVYLTAGILRLSFARFFAIDLVCATVVVGTFYWLTYFVGQQIVHDVSHALVVLSIIAAIALSCVGFYLWRRYRRKAAKLNEDAPEDALVASERAKPPAEGVAHKNDGACCR